MNIINIYTFAIIEVIWYMKVEKIIEKIFIF